MGLQFFGVVRAQQGRNVEAARMMESALALQPDDLGALINYSQVLTGTGRVQEALAKLDRALTIKPDVFEALYNGASRWRSFSAMPRRSLASTRPWP